MYASTADLRAWGECTEVLARTEVWTAEARAEWLLLALEEEMRVRTGAGSARPGWEVLARAGRSGAS